MCHEAVALAVAGEHCATSGANHSPRETTISYHTRDHLHVVGADHRDHGKDGRVSRVIPRVTREIFFDNLYGAYVWPEMMCGTKKCILRLTPGHDVSTSAFLQKYTLE